MTVITDYRHERTNKTTFCIYNGASVYEFKSDEFMDEVIDILLDKDRMAHVEAEAEKALTRNGVELIDIFYRFVYIGAASRIDFFAFPILLSPKSSIPQATFSSLNII